MIFIFPFLCREIKTGLDSDDDLKDPSYVHPTNMKKVKKKEENKDAKEEFLNSEGEEDLTRLIQEGYKRLVSENCPTPSKSDISTSVKPPSATTGAKVFKKGMEMVNGHFCCMVDQCRQPLFKTIGNLRRHWMLVHKKKVEMFKCPEKSCNLMLSQPYDIMRHVTRRHKKLSLPENTLFQRMLVTNPRYISPEGYLSPLTRAQRQSDYMSSKHCASPPETNTDGNQTNAKKNKRRSNKYWNSDADAIVQINPGKTFVSKELEESSAVIRIMRDPDENSSKNHSLIIPDERLVTLGTDQARASESCSPDLFAEYEQNCGDKDAAEGTTHKTPSSPQPPQNVDDNIGEDEMSINNNTDSNHQNCADDSNDDNNDDSLEGSRKRRRTSSSQHSPSETGNLFDDVTLEDAQNQIRVARFQKAQIEQDLYFWTNVVIEKLEESYLKEKERRMAAEAKLRMFMSQSEGDDV